MSYKFDSIVEKIEKPDFEKLLGACPGDRATPNNEILYRVSNPKNLDLITIKKYPIGTNVYSLEVAAVDDRLEKVLTVVQGKLKMEKIDKKTIDMMFRVKDYFA